MLAAWTWLTENEYGHELAMVMDSLALFHEIQGYFSTGRRNFSSLTARWQAKLAVAGVSNEETVHELRLLVKTKTWQSAFELNQHEAESLLQQSLSLLDDPRLAGVPSTAKERLSITAWAIQCASRKWVGQ